MNKTLPVLGFIGLAAIADSCVEKTELSNNTEFYFCQTNWYKGAQRGGHPDDMLIYHSPNLKLKLFRQAQDTSIYKMRLDGKLYERNFAELTETTADDSLFTAADELWRQCDTIQKIRLLSKFALQEYWEHKAARDAASRIYNSMDFVNK